MIKGVIHKLFYFLFPRRCELCGEVCEINCERCEDCRNVKHIEGEICLKCGREKQMCNCKNEKVTMAYNGVVAPFYYKGSPERAVRRLKNYGFCELAPKMAEEIADTVNNRYNNTSFDLITCVPLTKDRLKERGYNQSELLAKEVSKLLNINYEPVLDKNIKTKSQRYSSAKERRINLYGAIDLKEDAEVKDKTILIIDDVKTTGSTLNECASVLKGYKAKSVFGATFALTDKKT